MSAGPKETPSGAASPGWRSGVQAGYCCAHEGISSRARLGGGTLGHSPVPFLAATGRKAGKQRTRSLLYLADGENLGVVVSKGGAPTHPIW